MFGLREAVECCTSDVQIQSEWNEIYKRITAQNCDKDYGEHVKLFYKKLSSKILKEKLRTAKIGLCVIDEVHNWKNGSNGAEEFRDHYAENISNKLIMSATPFQIHEDELRTLFSYLNGVKNLSSEALDRIYQGENLLQKCIEKSADFYTAWSALQENDIQLFGQRITEIELKKSVTHLLSELLQYPGLSETLTGFISNALEYRKAIEMLRAELIQFVVRHTKGKQKRDYHIGKSYRPHELSAALPRRTVLYSTEGYANTADAFVNFLAIRLDQKIRQDTQSGYEVNAHLLGGITSSTAAFRKSNEKLCELKSVSPSTKDYQQLFMDILHRHPHPKVAATVERAFQNYCEGRKTLIFCERLATLKEISEELEKRIDAFIQGQSNAETIKRESVLRNHAFVDNYWWRSILQTLEPSKKINLESATKKALQNIKKELVLELSTYTPRQLLRKVDVLLFQQLSKGLESGDSVDKAFQLFSELGIEFTDDAIKRNIEDAETDIGLSEKHENLIDNYLLATNLWFGPERDTAEFHKSLWMLLESEAELLLTTHKEGESGKVQRILSFGDIVIDIMQGLRKIVLRDDLIARYLSKDDAVDSYTTIRNGFYSQNMGNQTVSFRLNMFLKNLFEANGSIVSRENTKRRSLWQGMFRKEMSAVDVLYGGRGQDARITLCAAFNSPLQPDILVCTGIGSEGIDLHRQCAEIIHHDLPWNPAKLEQRIGRIDRVGSLVELLPDRFIQIGIPFLEHNYEKYQYDLLWARAQRFEILMGQPDFDLNVQDEEELDEIRDEGSREESWQDEEKTPKLINDRQMVHLPREIMDYLRMDLSLSN